MAMISPEELARIVKMYDRYRNPPEPRAGHETIRLYEEIVEIVWANLPGILEAAQRGITK